ncbi:hypothetical protein FisN_19Hh081 [Fistulifera solaris]|uniref:Opine dehydrogenase domain-containing protein n=1 Tax=Fistulifera solaris TaxID=1519565 RepID=A0A1Z5K095_FISSO|nr:hypothetical protein FisN_19Hh081 [Fistulifera solaris]|eukprot:GAX19506.1 hypothetical protein FisN_19Hh081 [Fistulifera solaris]
MIARFRHLIISFSVVLIFRPTGAFAPYSVKTRRVTTDLYNDRVGIIGTGAVALGTAAFLNNNAMLWSPSGRPLSTEFFVTGALEDSSFTCRIATSARELVEENDIILLALPANGHKRVFDSIAPYLQENRHHVIISSHSSLGALYLSSLCQDEYNKRIPITAWGTTLVTARRTETQTVRVNTIRQAVDCCTIPVSYDATGIHRTLFPNIHFERRPGLLAISLSNLNPQNHLGIALGNMSRMDKNEVWYQSQNITPRIGKLLEDLDQERLAIADALGVNVKTIFEHFSWSFHVPMTSSIADMNQAIHEAGNDVYGPNTADTRYVTEDVPFGLPLIILLGEMVNRPAVLHRAGLEIMSSMYGRNFWAENDLLAALKLEQYTLDELQVAGRSGVLPSVKVASV